MGSLETRVAALALTLGIAMGSTMAAKRTGQIAPFARSDALPIVDVHGHLNADMSAAQLIDLMNQSGVRRMVLMPRTFSRPNSGGSGSDDQAVAFAKAYPGRFIPFVAGQRDLLNDGRRWLSPDREADVLL